MPAETAWGEIARAAMGQRSGGSSPRRSPTWSPFGRGRTPAAENYLRAVSFTTRVSNALQLAPHRPLAVAAMVGESLRIFLAKAACSQVFCRRYPSPPCLSGEACLSTTATGLVVGETAVIGDDVFNLARGDASGGTGKERGRPGNPKVARRPCCCALGQKVLGNVEIGPRRQGRRGAVLSCMDVPPRATVRRRAGPDRRLVEPGSVPALEMDQSLPDYEI